MIHICIYPTPTSWAECDTQSTFKWNTAGLNSEFSFSKIGCLIKSREPNLPYYLLITRGRIDVFMPLQWTLAWIETQIASSRIWTQVTNSISYNENWYVCVLLD